jgi:acyl CoA:acetate/3-ketoacid CoA transferase alpha subunit
VTGQRTVSSIRVASFCQNIVLGTSPATTAGKWLLAVHAASADTAIKDVPLADAAGILKAQMQLVKIDRHIIDHAAFLTDKMRVVVCQDIVSCLVMIQLDNAQQPFLHE